MPSELRNIRFEGQPGLLVITGYVSHQRTRREVRVSLTPQTILDLADAIRKCPRVLLANGEPAQVGHAMWHLENPELPSCQPLCRRPECDFPEDHSGPCSPRLGTR